MKRSTTKSSKYRGVSWCHQLNMWRARIKLHGRCEHLGYFDTEEEAARIYDKRSYEMNKRIAALNFPIVVADEEAKRVTAMTGFANDDEGTGAGSSEDTVKIESGATSPLGEHEKPQTRRSLHKGSSATSLSSPVVGNASGKKRIRSDDEEEEEASGDGKRQRMAPFAPAYYPGSMQAVAHHQFQNFQSPYHLLQAMAPTPPLMYYLQSPHLTQQQPAMPNLLMPFNPMIQFPVPTMPPQFNPGAAQMMLLNNRKPQPSTHETRPVPGQSPMWLPNYPQNVNLPNNPSLKVLQR